MILHIFSDTETEMLSLVQDQEMKLMKTTKREDLMAIDQEDQAKDHSTTAKEDRMMTKIADLAQGEGQDLEMMMIGMTKTDQEDRKEIKNQRMI